MHGKQRVDGLEVGTRGEHHGATAACGPPTARRGQRRQGHEPGYPSPHARILAGLRYSREIRRMLLPLARRALAGAAVVAGVIALTFVLRRAAPGDPVEQLVGPAATPEQVTPQRHALGRCRPRPGQCAGWRGRFARGDWGRSIVTGRPVRAVLGDAVPATLELAGLSLVLSYLLGLVIGAVQASAGPRLDGALSVTTVTLFALPGYWLGLALIIVFTYWGRALPAFGAAGLDADALTGWSRAGDRLRHLALPLATLTLIGIGGTARYVRGAMRDVLSQPFVRAARAKGLSTFQVTRRHVARNALIPVVTLLGLSLPALFSGTVFVEAVFAWPGVGRRLVEAVRARDYPVVMGATVVSAVLVVVGNLLADVATAWIDPGVRQARREP